MRRDGCVGQLQVQSAQAAAVPLGFICGSLPVPTVNPASNPLSPTQAAALVPAINLLSQRYCSSLLSSFRSIVNNQLLIGFSGAASGLERRAIDCCLPKLISTLHLLMAFHVTSCCPLLLHRMMPPLMVRDHSEPLFGSSLLISITTNFKELSLSSPPRCS